MKTPMDRITRRHFLGSAALAAAAVTASAAGRVSKLRFGFTTYQWGTDWDIPTLIANCTKAKPSAWSSAQQPSTNTAWRSISAMRAAERFDSPDAAKLAA